MNKATISEKLSSLLDTDVSTPYFDTLINSSMEKINNMLRHDLDPRVINSYKESLDFAVVTLVFCKHINLESLNTPSEMTVGEMKIKNPDTGKSQAMINNALSAISPILKSTDFAFISVLEEGDCPYGE